MVYRFEVGQFVVKTKGYKWPGVVVAAFITTSDKERYVVECTVPEVSGALHIYSPDQIELLSEAKARSWHNSVMSG